MKKFFLVLIAGFLALNLKAEKLLNDLDMEQGRWEMIGVSLHNYHHLDLQDQIGTFILRDQYILKQIREKWDFEEVFEDYCDYHYALKFYQDGELVKTMRVNLLCDYISIGGMSYKFSRKDFLEYKRYFKPIRWSRIRFRDLDLLKVAVNKLDEIPKVYWYGDVKMYNFKGMFTMQMDSLPWNTDKDSVIEALSDQIANQLGREDFYITMHYWTISDDLEWMTLRLQVFCEEDFFNEFTRKEPYVLRWRDHFSEQSFVQIVVIGMNREEYFKKMNAYN